MSVTNFDAVRLGKTVGAGMTTPALGDVACYQQAVLTQNSTTAVTAAFSLPANSQIISITVDVPVAFDSVTSAVLTAGVTTSGIEYVSGVSVKTAGRTLPTYSGTQVGNLVNIGANTTLYATVTPSGATTVGAVRVLVHYLPPSA